MDCEKVKFSSHAVQRMFERGRNTSELLSVLGDGEVIADYPDDSPYPSCLLLGFAAGRPLHVLVASEPGELTCHVGTVYTPDPDLWGPDFKTRRSP